MQSSIGWPAPSGGWPTWTWTVPYRGECHPGARGSLSVARGANCQRFVYAVLGLFGRSVPSLRSSDLWEDETATRQVGGDDPLEPLDLVLFNATRTAWGAHIAVFMSSDQLQPRAGAGAELGENRRCRPRYRRRSRRSRPHPIRLGLHPSSCATRPSLGHDAYPCGSSRPRDPPRSAEQHPRAGAPLVESIATRLAVRRNSFRPRDRRVQARRRRLRVCARTPRRSRDISCLRRRRQLERTRRGQAVGFGLVILVEQAPARAAPDDLPRLRGQAGAAVPSIADVVSLVSD